MRPTVRRLLLTVHLVLSLGWIGAVAAYLVLGVSAATAEESQTLRVAWIAMDLIGWFALVPLAVGALVSGVLMALGTPWGLFRHYWVLISFVLTVLAVTILLLHMPSVSAGAALARTSNDAAIGRLGGDLLHPAVGLLVLLVIAALNVYKPQGLTPWAWRKQHEEHLRRQAAK